MIPCPLVERVSKSYVLKKHIKKEGVLLYFGAYLPIIIDCKQDGMITPNRISRNDMISY